MADGLRVRVDVADLLAAITRAPEAIRTRAVRPQAHLTAQRIRSGAIARIHRRTGQTGAGVQVVERRDGNGYRVETGTEAGRPISLEFGTEHAAPRPFLYVEADLNADDHDRRMRDAIQDVIDEGF